jgi:hypothetical protein
MTSIFEQTPSNIIRPLSCSFVDARTLDYEVTHDDEDGHELRQRRVWPASDDVESSIADGSPREERDDWA